MVPFLLQLNVICDIISIICLRKLLYDEKS